MAATPQADRPSFDLTTEPWIPVADEADRVRDVSLRELLDDAPTLKRLASPFGPERMALTRILVAVAQSAVDGPREEREHLALFTTHEQRRAQMRDYLDEYADRFDLFDEERPFMQGPTIAGVGDGSIAALRLDWASGNNVTLFDHHVDDRAPTLTAAEAARALLTTLLYQPGGGVSKPFNRTDSPGTKAVMVAVEGENLWETLVANMWQLASESDVPAWERDPTAENPRPDGRVPLGPLDRLTWRSRRIRLLPNADGSVSRCIVHQHEKLADGSLGDRFVSLRLDPKTQEEKIIRVHSSRRLWRQSGVLLHGLSAASTRPSVAREGVRLMAELDPPRRPHVFAVGLRVDQAKIGDLQSAVLPVSRELLEDPECLARVEHALEIAEAGGTAISRAVFAFHATHERIANAYAGDESASTSKSVSERANGAADRWREDYWNQLGARFPALVGSIAGASTAPALDSPELQAWQQLIVDSVFRTASSFLSLQTPGHGGDEALVKAESALRKALTDVNLIVTTKKEAA